LSAFKDYTKSLAIVLGLGKRIAASKKAIQKKRFFRFYAKIAADIGFLSAALEKRKNQPNKKSKLFKCLIELFVNFSSIFSNLSKNFWINGITFLFLLLLLQIW